MAGTPSREAAQLLQSLATLNVQLEKLNANTTALADATQQLTQVLAAVGRLAHAVLSSHAQQAAIANVEDRRANALGELTTTLFNFLGQAAAGTSARGSKVRRGHTGNPNFSP